MRATKLARDQITLAKSMGYIVEPGRKHWKVKSPDGQLVTVIPLRPSDDRRALQNTLAQLRRAS